MSMFAIRTPDDVSYAVTAAVEAAQAASEAATAAAKFDPDAWARDMSALSLAQEMADRLDEPLNEVWDSLCHVPDNLLALLESPEGWGVLSSHVSVTLGHGPACILPAVH